MARLEAIDIPVAHGMLEGLIRLPEGDAPPPLVAVLAHPHPLLGGGGTMHTKAVFRMAQVFGDLGVPALRFNFRGVGRSTGSFDNGLGERDDVRAALDEAARRYPGIPLAFGGVSFGSVVGLPVAALDDRVALVHGVGVPVSLMRVEDLRASTQSKLIVQGEFDEFGPLPELEAWFARIPGPKALRVVPGADHLFTRHQQELTQTLREAYTTYLANRTF